MNLEIVKKTHIIKDDVQTGTSSYFHSIPIAVSKSKIVLKGKALSSICSFNIIYGLKDLLLIGALTENPVLMTGGTDLGKTTLARLMMTSLFGKEEKGWHRLDFDLDFGKDAYTDVNSTFFHESGKSLKDLYSLHKWMQLPGFIADELNGAHPKIARKALHIIKEKDITLSDGRRVKIGQILPDGSTYQFQIATINEGKEYSGTFDLDKALRRRTTIEIPLDIFRPSALDRLLLQKFQGVNGFEGMDKFDQIIEIFNSIKDIKIHPVTELFISYLQAFDYCKYSLTGEKSSIESKNGSVHHVCTQAVKVGSDTIGDMGCIFLRTFHNNLCSEVRGITPGVSKNLISVSKGFALLRSVKFVEMMEGMINNNKEENLSYSISDLTVLTESLKSYVGKDVTGEVLAKLSIQKYIENLEVEHEDIISAMCFVLYSKIGLSPAWVTKYYQGNKFEAVSNFCNQADIHFREGLARPELDNLSAIIQNGPDILQSDFVKIKDYCLTDNPWLWIALSPYFEKQNSHISKPYNLYDI